MKHSFRLLILFSVMAFSACSSNSTSEKTAATTRNPVDPPFDQIKLEANEYVVDATANDTIRAATGSSIIIPAGVLVDKQGNPVQGEVKFRFREFHTAAEVIASGVTMLYDSAGKVNSFETAGMFELTASQNGNEVFIKPGKAIEVNVASKATGSFNAYKLDTVARNWVYLSTPESDSTPAFKALQAQIDALGLPPAPPQPRNAALPLLNIDIDPALRPELAGYTNLVWQYTGQGSDPDKSPGLYTTQWQNITLTPNEDQTSYSLTLSAPDGKRFQTNVRPVFSGSDLKKAQEQFKSRLASWEEKRAAIEANREEIIAYNRRVSVISFGIYNCDRIYSRPDNKNIQVLYSFDDPDFTKDQDEVVLFLLADNAAIQQYSANSGANLLYSPSMQNGLIAIHKPSGKVAMLKREGFKKALGAVSKAGAPVAFVLTGIARKVATFADFNSVVESL